MADGRWQMAAPRGLKNILWASLAILIIFPAPAFAVSSATLVEESKRFDGKTVTFTGEAIGDLMERRDGVWVNVNDDAYSRQGSKRRLAGFNSGQAVLLPKSAAGKIKRLGDYNNRGDLIRVVGIFHQACPRHGGDMMIHGRSLEVVKPGFALIHKLSLEKISLAVSWLAVSLAILSLWRWRRTRRR